MSPEVPIPKSITARTQSERAAFDDGLATGLAATSVTDEMVERAAMWLGGDRDWARNILLDALGTKEVGGNDA